MMSVVLSNTKTDLWCHFNYSKDHTVSSKVIFHEMCENHNLPFGGWILSCDIPEAVVITCSVALSTSSFANDVSGVSLANTTILVVESGNSLLRHSRGTFAVCVPPVFGNFSPKKLIEFFEIMNLLGASKIFMYVVTKNENIQRVLRYYEKKNYAVLIPWKLPFSNVITRNVTTRRGIHSIKISSVWYNGQSVAANDCLYRTMSGFAYVLFSDLDEILVPKSELYNWKNVVDLIMKYTASGYSFKSAYFQVNSGSGLASLGSVRTLEFSPSRNKVMVHPDRVFEVGIHHVSSSIPGNVKYEVYHVPETVAFIHHFRTCQREYKLNCSRTVSDYTVREKYKHTLEHAVDTISNKFKV